MKRILETSRSLRVALVISLAANVFFATVFAIKLAQAPRHHGLPNFSALEQHLLKRLSESDGAIVQRALQTRHTEIDQQIAAVKQTRAVLRQALQAKPVDPTALSAAFQGLRMAMQSLHASVQSALVTAAPEMSATGRLQLVPEHRDGR